MPPPHPPNPRVVWCEDNHDGTQTRIVQTVESLVVETSEKNALGQKNWVEISRVNHIPPAIENMVARLLELRDGFVNRLLENARIVHPHLRDPVFQLQFQFPVADVNELRDLATAAPFPPEFSPMTPPVKEVNPEDPFKIKVKTGMPYKGLYGWCPRCGLPGVIRERGIAGFTFCANNHPTKHGDMLPEQPAWAKGATRHGRREPPSE